MDLTGTWRAAPADEELRRQFHLRDFDAAGWEQLSVPGHWQDTPAFADHDDAVFHRHEFTTADAADAGERTWLELDGLFYQGDIYLDDQYLGDTEGYFVRHAFDVTDQVRSGHDHVLAMEISCRPAGAGKQRSLMGVFEGGNDVIHRGNPGGVWAPVRLRHTGPVRLSSLRAICERADHREAVVRLRATLESRSIRSVRIVTELAGIDHELDQPIAEGTNEFEWRVTVPDPKLWWPQSLGEQPLHDLRVRVETRSGETSDERVLSIGLRSIRARKWRTFVNDEPLFLKGVNVAPTDAHLAAATPERVLAQLRMAQEAGFDLVRPYAHVAPPTFYDHADRLGLLVWQDLPLLGPASSNLRGQAVRQATKMVDQLGHHASIAVWNSHVSPSDEWMHAEPPSVRRFATRFASHQLPTWTKSVLDRSIKRVFDNADGSRPSTGFTGVLPHLPRLEGSATHLWFGWRRGAERDLTDFAARIPSQVRFVAEFGAQSVPSTGEVADAVSWPHVPRERLHDRYGYETASFERYVPPVGHPDATSWIEATQQYQAGLLRRQIEALRRLKYNPSGGFCVHFLADAQPRVSAALIDSDGHAKAALAAVTQACRPVIVVADRLPARLQPGDPIALDVHVVNDRHEDLHEAEVIAEMTWPGGSHRWRYGGSIDADSVTRVGTVSWVVPDARGLATLTLRLTGPADESNRYHATIG